MSAPELVLVCVLELLGRSTDRLGTVRVVESPPDAVSPNAQAFLNRADGVIYLIASAPAFRDILAAQRRGRSRCGPRRSLVVLASIVVHEEWHRKFGSDEKGAYEAQLFELVRHGMTYTPENADVRRSMAVVLAKHATARAPLSVRGEAQSQEGTSSASVSSTRPFP